MVHNLVYNDISHTNMTELSSVMWPISLNFRPYRAVSRCIFMNLFLCCPQTGSFELISTGPLVIRTIDRPYGPARQLDKAPKR